MLKFGVVGAGAFVIDAGGFNLLVYGGGHGPLHHRPLTAKIISASLSVIAAWLGNRYWTFRRRRRPQVHHELFLFAVVNGVGLLIAVVCLGFSRYVLGPGVAARRQHQRHDRRHGARHAVPVLGLPAVRLR